MPMYVCMYACMHACMYGICITSVHAYVFVYMCTHAHMHAFIRYAVITFGPFVPETETEIAAQEPLTRRSLINQQDEATNNKNNGTNNNSSRVHDLK